MISKNLLTIVSVFALALLACTLSGAPPATQTPAEATPLPPDAVVLTWSRVGGIAGFCDLLTITADGAATATTCQAAFLPAPKLLAPADWAQLQAWLEAIGPYSDTMTDGAVADSMTTTLDFYGRGPGEAGEMEMQSLLDFAARIYAELYEPPAPPAQAAPCMVSAVSDITVYGRPSTEAGVFGVVGSGEAVAVTAQSVNGWYGFDPDVAQAANVGVFRLRWIPPDADAEVSGDCDLLPVAPVLSPQACYTMAPTAVLVYAEPDATSPLVVLLPFEGFAAVTGVNADGWLQVDLSDSSEPQDAAGWVSPGDANFNGPCEALPDLP
ncbi:MAG TPA: hypothetical protein VMN57_15895 [Anaerolineales bacterium]|nr:hypothetical protein [Anaerolineales bacterium]